jgi:hypothetical protein
MVVNPLATIVELFPTVPLFAPAVEPAPPPPTVIVYVGKVKTCEVGAIKPPAPPPPPHHTPAPPPPATVRNSTDKPK